MSSIHIDIQFFLVETFYLRLRYQYALKTFVSNNNDNEIFL